MSSAAALDRPTHAAPTTAAPRGAQSIASTALDQSWGRRFAAWTWMFVALGCTVRLVRYLLCYPLWGDECMLAENFLTRDFAGLVEPLDHQQVAPLFFLWIELAIVRLLGFSEWSLRLFPLVCGLASVVLFRHVAARLTTGAATVLATAVFAVAYYPIRHAVEVKPYAVDTCITQVLLTLAVEHWRRPGTSRWLWLLAAVAPLAVGLSFPAVFVGGGVSLALLLDLCWNRRREAILPWLAYNLLLVAAFAALFWLSESKRYDASASFMTACWGECFPPLTRPLELAVWLLRAHTGEMFAHPIGGENFASLATTVCFVIGLAAMGRARLGVPLAMWLCTMLLALAAASLERYPYGETSRLMQYAAPLVCLPAGIGMAALIALLRDEAWQRRAMVALPAVLGALAFGITAEGLAQPYKHHGDYVHRGFAMWFWNQEASDAVASTDRDLGLGFFYPGCERSTYACYQAIYGRVRPSSEIAVPSTRDAQSPSEPAATLNCVIFEGASGAAQPKLAAWLAEMDRTHSLVRRDRYCVVVDDAHHALGYYDVYRFRPRPLNEQGPLAARPHMNDPAITSPR